MIIPTEFWKTTGKGRLEAVLLRYDQQQLGAKIAVEYLAELLPDSAKLSEGQQQLVQGAYHLVHDLFDGFAVEEHDYEALLTRR